MSISNSAFRSDPSDEFDDSDDYQVQLVFNYFLCCVVIVLLAAMSPSVSIGQGDQTEKGVQSATAGYQANLDAFEYITWESTDTHHDRTNQDETIPPTDFDRVHKLTEQAAPL